MRLAKYGKRLRENYMAFKDKGAPIASDLNCYSVPLPPEEARWKPTPTDHSSRREKAVRMLLFTPNQLLKKKKHLKDSDRSRVAMDFSGPVGRIVEDPQEAQDIAAAENSRSRLPRPLLHRPPPPAPVDMDRSETQAPFHPSVLRARVHPAIYQGIHLKQPWFHATLLRDDATRVVAILGHVDGVFLVRHSSNTRYGFVITYKFNEKVHHTQVHPIYNVLRDRPVFSIDGGLTRFYDLLQLIEFYQLNSGCMPTRLTHYIAHDLLAEHPIDQPSTSGTTGDSGEPQPHTSK